MNMLERILLGSLIAGGLVVVVPKVAQHVLALFPAGWVN